MNRVFPLLLILVAVSFSSCLDKVTYPPEPVIEYKSFTQNAEGAVLSFDFTDGDGNLGLNQGDTTGVYCPGCEFYHNLFCEYYELQNGVWTHIPLSFEEGFVPFYYRVPAAEPSGQNPALNGTIDIDMPFYFLISDFDTCRFEVKLFDRDLNESNMIESRSFVKP